MTHCGVNIWVNLNALREPRAMSREVRARFGPPNPIRATANKQQTGSYTAHHNFSNYETQGLQVYTYIYIDVYIYIHTTLEGCFFVQFGVVYIYIYT